MNKIAPLILDLLKTADGRLSKTVTINGIVALMSAVLIAVQTAWPEAAAGTFAHPEVILFLSALNIALRAVTSGPLRGKGKKAAKKDEVTP